MVGGAAVFYIEKMSEKKLVFSLAEEEVSTEVGYLEPHCICTALAQIARHTLVKRLNILTDCTGLHKLLTLSRFE